MIVQHAETVLHLITQPEHAALAAHIMEHWEPLRDAERRASIMLAIEEHDNGWREPDAAPSVDPATGRIHDFISAPASVRQGVWPRGIARLSHHPWAAALVAQHALTVYDRYRSDEEWASFFSGIESIRDAVLASTGHSLEQLITDYAFVRIGDLISLIFCNQWTEQQEYDGWTFRLDGKDVMVSPDPFRGRNIPIAITARQIAGVPYHSDADLSDALRSCSVIRLHGVVSGEADGRPPRDMIDGNA